MQKKELIEKTIAYWRDMDVKCASKKDGSGSYYYVATGTCPICEEHRNDTRFDFAKCTGCPVKSYWKKLCVEIQWFSNGLWTNYATYNDALEFKLTVIDKLTGLLKKYS